MKKLTLWFLLTLGGALASADELREVQFHVSGAGAVVLNGEAPTAVLPELNVDVKGPLAIGTRAPATVYSELKLYGLPSELEDVEVLKTLKAVDLSVGLQREVGRIAIGTQIITTAVFAEAGFSTRLAHEPAPLTRYPRHGAVGFRIGEEVSGAHLRVGIGPDQRLDGAYQPALKVRGQVRLWKHSESGVSLILRGTGILSINDLSATWPGAKRDVLSIALGVAR